MSKQETKIKDTGLGKWLKSKAPNVLDVVGDLLPDQGGLGIVKNLTLTPMRGLLPSMQRSSFRTT